MCRWYLEWLVFIMNKQLDLGLTSAPSCRIISLLRTSSVSIRLAKIGRDVTLDRCKGTIQSTWDKEMARETNAYKCMDNIGEDWCCQRWSHIVLPINTKAVLSDYLGRLNLGIIWQLFRCGFNKWKTSCLGKESDTLDDGFGLTCDTTIVTVSVATLSVEVSVNISTISYPMKNAVNVPLIVIWNSHVLNFLPLNIDDDWTVLRLEYSGSWSKLMPGCKQQWQHWTITAFSRSLIATTWNQ